MTGVIYLKKKVAKQLIGKRFLNNQGLSESLPDPSTNQLSTYQSAAIPKTRTKQIIIITFPKPTKSRRKSRKIRTATKNTLRFFLNSSFIVN